MSKQRQRQVGIVIGRFSPPHAGHRELIMSSLDRSDLTIIVVGSANCAPNIKNPWTSYERVIMLHSLFHDGLVDQSRMQWIGVTDHPYNDNAWLRELKIKLNQHLHENDIITLIGYDKDESTTYLKWFPEWSFLDVGQKEGGVNATSVREYIFENNDVPDTLPDGVKKFLTGNWMGHDTHRRLLKEYKFVKKIHDESWDKKYKPVLTCTDAVVVTKGKVLTTLRKNTDYGYGLRSLPGAVVRYDETLQTAAIRAAFEKGGMIVKPEWIKNVRYFDRPDRSLAGRRISHAFLFEIPDSWNIKHDANRGEWIDMSDVDLYSEEFFEDHAAIIEEMTK